MDDLFQTTRPEVEHFADGVTVLSNFVDTDSLLSALAELTAVSPFRHMSTPGGKRINVAVTNCGKLGWVSDARGYRYQALDPQSNKPWPAMPALWRATAVRAAELAGYDHYSPNACLINRYLPGNRMTAHQDKNERDFSQPVVTISTGLPTRFLVYGDTRGGKPLAIPVYDGDVIVMGGASRMAFHGVREIDRPADDPRPHRISLTFRDA
ncbi:MAG: alpha-ketoglutarate-dependent dioxygenase AlkB [Pseudomonadota bacterium]